MTNEELWERIKLAWECPNVIWELDRKNGFCWFEDGEFYATPGVAVAMIDYDGRPDERFVDRSVRAEALGMEWHYLMHFEMAINQLFWGYGIEYNLTKLFPFVERSYFERIGADNFYKLEKIVKNEY